MTPLWAMAQCAADDCDDEDDEEADACVRAAAADSPRLTSASRLVIPCAHDARLTSPLKHVEGVWLSLHCSYIVELIGFISTCAQQQAIS